MAESNLIPNSQRTPEELREMTRKGGRKSGESRRRKKAMREWLELALSTKVRDRDGKLVMSPDTGKPMTREEAGMLKLAAQFANGDLNSIKLTAELLGEKVERHELTGKDGADLSVFPKLTNEDLERAMRFNESISRPANDE